MKPIDRFVQEAARILKESPHPRRAWVDWFPCVVMRGNIAALEPGDSSGIPPLPFAPFRSDKSHWWDEIDGLLELARVAQSWESLEAHGVVSLALLEPDVRGAELQIWSLPAFIRDAIGSIGENAPERFAEIIALSRAAKHAEETLFIWSHI